MRTEFGAERSNCACSDCQTNCQFMPGFLIPADLDRLIPAGADPFDWAADNLLASPGALVMVNGEKFRIPTLVPAVKADGSCINLGPDGRCGIHEAAPFGCAFFSCGPEVPGLAHKGVYAVYSVPPDGLYKLLWTYLSIIGKTQLSPVILRERMRQHLGITI